MSVDKCEYTVDGDTLHQSLSKIHSREAELDGQPTELP